MGCYENPSKAALGLIDVRVLGQTSPVRNLPWSNPVRTGRVEVTCVWIISGSFHVVVMFGCCSWSYGPVGCTPRRGGPAAGACGWR